MKLFYVVSLAFLLFASSASTAQSIFNNNTLSAPLLPLPSVAEKSSDDSDGIVYYQCYVNPVSCY
ncbi:hypothetical protein [Vibrio sp. AND4]|uniref:hypothetical protein n=1 Tax=Vibrio sp. AND4 TaxID=314289 RepID=UPI0005C49E8F|nr:hypothetical protein [Vibrio sp. AND4]